MLGRARSSASAGLDHGDRNDLDGRGWVVIASRRLRDLHDDVLARDNLAEHWVLRLREIRSPPNNENQ